MADQRTLMSKLKTAVDSGTITADNYRSAISATRDNPEVKDYLESTFESTPETQVLPDQYSIDGREVSRDAFEQRQREESDGYIGNVNPESLVVSEEPEEMEPRDTPTELTDITSSTRKGRREQSDQREADKQAMQEEVEQAYRDAREAEYGKVITLEDIKASQRLRELGVLSGDRIKDNKLVRIHSREEDAVKIDTVITEQDIRESKILRDAGAVVGDLIVKNEDGTRKFVSREKDDSFKQFMYSKDLDSNWIENAFTFLAAAFPMPDYAYDLDPSTFGNPAAMIAAMEKRQDLLGEGGDVVTTVEEKFAGNPADLTFDQRRLAVRRMKERRQQITYGNMFDFQPDSTAAMLGSITKAVIDPINAIPAMSTIKRGMGVGGLIAGGGSVFNDLLQTESGEVDGEKAAYSATAGVVLSGVLLKGGQVLGNKLAHKQIAKAQRVLDKGIREGADPTDPLAIVKAGGINPAKLLEAQKRVGEKIHINTQKALDVEADKVMVNDSAVGRRMNKKIDEKIGVLITRIGNISESIQGRVKKFEWDTSNSTATSLKTARGFVEGLGELGDDVKNQIARSLYNEDFDAARALMPEGLAQEFDLKVLPMLSKLGDDLQESGHNFQKIENYFPRLVTDLKGLQDSLGVKQKGLIDKARLAYADSKKIGVEKLTDEENTEIIDNLVRGYSMIKKDGKPGFVRNRKLELTEDQMKYYATPEESLSIYLRRSASDLEKRRFLGQHYVKDGSGRSDIDNSIGSYVRKEYDEGRIGMEDQEELISLLKSRFIGGEQSPHAALQVIRDLGYMGTIANPASTITQFADLGLTSALKGFRNTISTMFSEKNVSVIDIGIEDASAEMAEQGIRGTANALRKLLGVSGFRKIDRLGKETYINSAIKRASNMLKTKKGSAKLRKEFGEIYGEETDDVLASLASGKVDYNTKWFAFNELSDAQPTTRSNFPQFYLDNPNMRVLYMLKSFTVKQIDVVRRRVIGEYQKGNKKEAIKQATLLAGYLTTANLSTGVIKDLMLGREIDADDIPSKSLWALLGNYGASKYTTDKYVKKGDWKGAIYNPIVPATPVIDMIVEGVQIPFKDEPNYRKIVTNIPVVGRLFSSWFLGGAEDYNERQETERKGRNKYKY